MRRFALVVLAVCVLTVGLPALASAGCTASLNCGGACNLGLECPSPPYNQPWWISCFAPDQVVQCSGNNTCTVGSNFVECDGVKTYCWGSSWCYQGTNYLRCGTTQKSCERCQSGADSCFI